MSFLNALHSSVDIDMINLTTQLLSVIGVNGYKLILLFYIIVIIIKRICRAPIYRTKWEHRVLYNNTNNNNTHTHARTHACIRQGDRHGCERGSLEIVIEQVHLVGGFVEHLILR